MLDLNNHPVLLVMAIGVIAPLLVEIPIGFRLPTVVLEMVVGIVVGPHVLGFVRAEGLLEWLGGSLGLAALFFMAGMELDLERVRGRPLSLAAGGWLLSLALGLAAAGLLYVLGFVQYPMILAVTLTTTAVGTLLPILRDGRELETEFGRLVLAAGAVGEFGPIVMVSLLFTRKYGAWLQVGFMLALIAITVLAAFAALRVRSPQIVELLTRTMHSSTQLPVRVSVLFVAFLFVLSETLGLDAVLGAFAAGMVVGLATRGEDGKTMRQKIDAVFFGFQVPFFFVLSGINFDLGGLLQSARTMLLIPVFLTLFLVVRGAPVLLYRNDLPKGERLSFALYVSTALPMVVAITHMGVQTGRMQSDIAGALVGAAILSVLLFPAIGAALRSKSVSLAPSANTGQRG
jgi:Kef-type K+ transport system membrane component KefB